MTVVIVLHIFTWGVTVAHLVFRLTYAGHWPSNV